MANYVSWERFSFLNENPHIAFEKMTKILFRDTYCAEKTTLHSNPNNPGIETIPAFGINGKRIGFQAKYFTSRINYQSIRDSMSKAAQYYKGELEAIYLFSNKDLTITCGSYKEIETILGDAGIALTLVTGEELLGLVMNNDVVKDTFFGTHSIDQNWLQKQTSKYSQVLGKRYNKNFNVETKTQKYLELFCRAEIAAEDINARRNEALEDIRKSLYRKDNLLEEAYNIVKDLGTLDANSLENYLDWKNQLIEIQDKIEQEITFQIQKRESVPKDERRDIENSLYRLKKTNDAIDTIIVSKTQVQLITSQVLLLTGDAGTGKSHCFCEISLKMSSIGRGLLLLGNAFVTNTRVETQILDILGLSDISFLQFLNSLEGLGELVGNRVTIFIDGINECKDKDIWDPFISNIVFELKQRPHVGFAFSFRSGYENMLFNTSSDEQKNHNSIVQITHEGFIDNSIEAINQFLNFYRIPFIPEYYFISEFHNPLLLLMFCETYDGSSFDLNNICKKTIETADYESKRAINFHEVRHNLCQEFINEFAELLLRENRWSIEKDDILTMQFWEKHGINQKWQYITALINSNLLISLPYREKEYFQLGFNLLQDYLLALSINQRFHDQDAYFEYIVRSLLEIDEGRVKNISGVNVFVFLCPMYFQKFGNEPLEQIMDQLHDDPHGDKFFLLNEYIKSYGLRDDKSISKEYFQKILNKYQFANSSTIFNVLLANSLRINSELNATYLHELLIRMPLNVRDYIWTIYINDKTFEGERLFEIIKRYELEATSELDKELVFLMCLLLTWVLSSSNRVLRDHASTALVEILAQNLSLTLELLVRFKNVNDPYVLQRLYAAIYGAINKRTPLNNEIFKKLVNYIYINEFKSGAVREDILFREYARGIIDRWLYENPNNELGILPQVYCPPYQTPDLPTMKRIKYGDLKPNKGTYQIISSMRPNLDSEPGWYGDFGRYVFQAFLNRYQKVNIQNAFYYAMHYIINKLGYDDDMFSNYDTGYFINRTRHDTKKIERIGKKYQWIALHHILARISDNYSLKENELPSGYCEFERDYDPTLNESLLDDPQARLSFKLPNHQIQFIQNFNADKSEIINWVNDDTSVFDLDKESLIITDTNGTEWVKLYQTLSIDHKNPNDIMDSRRNVQKIWRYAFSYFVKSDEFNRFIDVLKGQSFHGRWFPEGGSSSFLFCREMYWSPLYWHYFGDSWQEYKRDTGEIEQITHKWEDSWVKFERLLYNTEVEEHPSIWIEQKKVQEVFGRVLPSYLLYSWEGHYDASKKETVSFSIPCEELVSTFGLEQRQFNGFFYSGNHLVVYDSNFNDTGDSLIIRKDYLIEFLRRKKYKIFWTLLGEKQFIKGYDNQIWSERSGVAFLNNKNEIEGTMRITKRGEESSHEL